MLPASKRYDEQPSLSLNTKDSSISRVGHLILRELAIQASSPQNALALISYHSPKSDHDHAVTMASPLVILPKTSSSCSSRKPLNHRQLSGFFFLFLFNDFQNSGNILPHFGKELLHIFKLTRGTRTDQKQAMLSSTW